MIIQGDCREVLRGLPSKSVNCCVTSPPYFRLRDYGCTDQIGLEETPEAYAAQMVEVFREVRRVLRDDGTLWLNLGDSYVRTGGTDRKVSDSAKVGSTRNAIRQMGDRTSRTTTGLKPKNLIGIPWRVAFALQADGWYLRQDIIWHKPNPMPESVTDRCTKAHEYIFLFSKSPRYYYDYEAIKEPIAESSRVRLSQSSLSQQCGSDRVPGKTNGLMKAVGNLAGRNRRSVWTVATRPYKGAHFATFPPDLIEPCVLAGCPEGGTVLDPFNGSGTTGAVAIASDREYIGIELNQEYIDLSWERICKAVGL